MSCRMAFLIAAALAVCGCSAHAARDPAAPPAADGSAGASPTVNKLDGTAWRFVEVEGIAVPVAVTATLRFNAGHASGKAGCNAYGATYQIAADGTAHFKRGMSTKMACMQPAGVMQVEHGVFSALGATAKVAIDNGELVLLDAAGKPVAKLARDGTQ